MKVAVTGSTGFLGQRVIARLLAEGAEVAALVRPNKAVPAQWDHSNLHVVRGTLEDHNGESARLLAGADLLLHLAAHGVQSRARDWEGMHAVNCQAPLHWLQRAGKHSGVRVIAAGTCFEYAGHGHLPDEPGEPLRCTEGASLETASGYGASKAAGGLLIRAFARAYGIDLWYLRFASLYGPGDDPDKFLPYALRMIARRERPDFSGCAQVREWLHVDDAVDAILRAIDTPPPGGVGLLNVGTGEGVTLRHVVEYLARWSGYHELVEGIGRRPYRTDEVHHLVMDCREAERLLGWHAKCALEEGLRTLIKKEGLPLSSQP